MRINSISRNIINNNHRSITYTSSQNSNKKNITSTHEQRYNEIVALSGIGTLACLGIALTYTLYSGGKSGKKHLKKYVAPTQHVYKIRNNTIYHGPSINTETPLSTAWSNYISGVEKRINSYHSGNYEKVFTKNEKKLDMFEKVAEEIAINHKIISAA